MMVSLGVFALMVFAIAAIIHRPNPPPAPPLPLGKVEPYLWTDMLLAPDGTLWSLEHSGTGGPSSLILTPRAPGNDWKQVSGVANRGVGVKEDGTLWFWRQSHGPVFGSGSLAPPVKIGLEQDWAFASHSWNYAPLLKKDGSLWYLGDEVIDPRHGPTQITETSRPSRIGNENDWVKITNSNGAFYALKRDGSLWRWGFSKMGAPFELTPVPFGSGHAWKTFSRCSHALAAIRGDGSLWVSKFNVASIAPDIVSAASGGMVPISNEPDWQSVVGGEDNLLAGRKDGSWWVSGNNEFSQLGIAKKGAGKLGKPTRLNTKLDIWAWSAAGESTLILTRDGSFYYMGMTPNGRAKTGVIANIKGTINRTFSALPGGFRTFSNSAPSHAHPVKIGELPERVIESLKGSGS
ncbi:MAG: hypothetical protein ACO1QR_14130 [Chthoniobacteraceae bacterium]